MPVLLLLLSLGAVAADAPEADADDPDTDAPDTERLLFDPDIPVAHPGQEPDPDAAHRISEDRHVLIADNPLTGSAEVLAAQDLATRAEQGPVQVSGRLRVARPAGFRSVWVEHDGVERLLIVEPERATWPVVGPGQVLLIEAARLVEPSATVIRQLSWLELSPGEILRQPVLIVSTDEHVEVGRSEDL